MHTPWRNGRGGAASASAGSIGSSLLGRQRQPGAPPTPPLLPPTCLLPRSARQSQASIVARSGRRFERTGSCGKRARGSDFRRPSGRTASSMGHARVDTRNLPAARCTSPRTLARKSSKHALRGPTVKQLGRSRAHDRSSTRPRHASTRSSWGARSVPAHVPEKGPHGCGQLGREGASASRCLDGSARP